MSHLDIKNAKPGDRVRLISNSNLDVALGSMATVIARKYLATLDELDKFIYIAWDNNITCINGSPSKQGKGGYYFDHFVLVSTTEVTEEFERFKAIV